MREYIFGFGRRSCPGRELADASLFMFVAMSVAALDIRPLAGADLSTMVDVKEGKGWVPGTITFVLSYYLVSGSVAEKHLLFQTFRTLLCHARPRSPAIEALVRAVETEYPWNDHDAEAISHLDLKRRL